MLIKMYLLLYHNICSIGVPYVDTCANVQNISICGSFLVYGFQMRFDCKQFLHMDNVKKFPLPVFVIMIIKCLYIYFLFFFIRFFSSPKCV